MWDVPSHTGLWFCVDKQSLNRIILHDILSYNRFYLKIVPKNIYIFEHTETNGGTSPRPIHPWGAPHRSTPQTDSSGSCVDMVTDSLNLCSSTTRSVPFRSVCRSRLQYSDPSLSCRVTILHRSRWSRMTDMCSIRRVLA